MSLLCRVVRAAFSGLRSRRRACSITPGLRWVAVNGVHIVVTARYLSALIFGFKSQDRSRNKADRCAYHLLMLWEGNDASLLRVVESALESVPQVLLQSYVLITAQEQEPSVVLAQVGSIGFGVGSAAWSLVAYVRTLRFSREDSLNVSWLATVVCYCSHLMVLTPRLTALALFSSVFHWWTLLVCGIRWLVMYTWLIMCVRIKQYENRCDKFCFKVVLALIYISCFIDLAQKDRRYNGIFFYAFTFCENALLLGLWYCYNQSSPWYETLALVGSFLSFCVGMACLVIYYLLLHPNASSIAQSVMQDLNKWIDYVSKRSKDSPVELPNAEHGSSPCVHLTESVCNSDPLETSGDLAFEDTGGANDIAIPLHTLCDSHAIEYS
ncbi:XK-related protein 6 isoform X2 [Rhipicephalus microplus]|uniref:XK-related protein 6 isoform X2 n=1 Tax=Rhipicephalus microplus TaxID=6941 RepID=UPI003F6B08CD